MKKINSLAIALLLGVTSVANAAWWDEENSYYNSVSSNSQVYTQADEDLALAMAISASMHDFDTKNNMQALSEVTQDSALRSNNVRNTGKVGANIWMHNTYPAEGPNNAYALVATQRKMSVNYYGYEQQHGTFAAQNLVMNDAQLNEDDLLQYVLQLSLLNR